MPSVDQSSSISEEKQKRGSFPKNN
uniref:Uncharacterized protein n=1 Tax=Arundo donax TaxID=35708 RepID=A0A0A8Y1Q6_ARUDO